MIISTTYGFCLGCFPRLNCLPVLVRVQVFEIFPDLLNLLIVGLSEPAQLQERETEDDSDQMSQSAILKYCNRYSDGNFPLSPSVSC